ncbi:MAG TPA: hypothetical protein VIJ25_17310 [Methylococcales bacterium]
MQIRTIKFPYVPLAFLVFLWAGSLAAQERGASHGFVQEAASGPPSAYVEPFGVALAPPINLINFLFLYVANPEIAAFMPAYRAALPQEVYDCLLQHPDGYGCPYADMQKYFDEQAFDGGGSRNKNSFWPSACQEDPRWERLAARKYRHPDEINQPLGMRKAKQLARLLGIDDDMVLTAEQYQCMITTSTSDPESLNVTRKIIYACSNDLTNSNGHADTPLSSYGLSLNEKGDVRSNCAPKAPCLVFNKLLAGPLEALAKQCGFADKLARLVSETPFLQFAADGSACQEDWTPQCIVEATCPGNGGQSNNSCAATIASPAPD